MLERKVAADEVAIQPTEGVAAVVCDGERPRAVILHPADFHRLAVLEELLGELIETPRLEPVEAAGRARVETEAPSDRRRKKEGS